MPVAAWTEAVRPSQQGTGGLILILTLPITGPQGDRRPCLPVNAHASPQGPSDLSKVTKILMMTGLRGLATDLPRAKGEGMASIGQPSVWVIFPQAPTSHLRSTGIGYQQKGLLPGQLCHFPPSPLLSCSWTLSPKEHSTEAGGRGVNQQRLRPLIPESHPPDAVHTAGRRSGLRTRNPPFQFCPRLSR